MRFLKDSPRWREKSSNVRMDDSRSSLVGSLDYVVVTSLKYLGMHDLNGYLMCLYCDSIVIMKMGAVIEK